MHAVARIGPPGEGELTKWQNRNPLPFLQRLMDNHFLLLFLGVVIPTVFYILWGVIEITQIPVGDY